MHVPLSIKNTQLKNAIRYFQQTEHEQKHTTSTKKEWLDHKCTTKNPPERMILYKIIKNKQHTTVKEDAFQDSKFSFESLRLYNEIFRKKLHQGVFVCLA